MKLKNRLFAVILTLCLVCSLADGCFAEPCYENIKRVLTSAVELAGTPDNLFSYPVEMEFSGEVMLAFDLDIGELSVIGVNEYGEYEFTTWVKAPRDDALMFMAASCGQWDLLQGMLGDGYRMTYEIFSSDINKCLTIDSAEGAYDFMMNVQQYME